MPKDLPDFGSMFGNSGRGDAAPIPDIPATETDVEAFKASVLAKLALAVGKDGDSATARDWFVATALALRDRVIHRWLAVNRASRAEGKKHVYYLSLEFLIGRLFADVVENLRLTETVAAALGDLGVDLDRMRRAEPDAALGNGGLGRLAACLMESMASLGIPAFGYGIRYDHGLFRQVIRDGWQQEFAEDWLSFGNPWEFARPEVVYDIQFGGRVEMVTRRAGPRAAGVAPGRDDRGGRLRHADRRLARPAREPAAAVVGARRRSAAPRIVQRGRPCRRAVASRPAPRRSRKSFIRATIPRPAANCGCGRNISSSRPRCRTSCAGTCKPTTICRRCRSTRRSSSTTRIRASPSPS